MKEQAVVDALHYLNAVPRVHPNGFIQLDLRSGHRLHVWDVRIKLQEPPTPVHDHIFDMKSTILLGKIAQNTHEFFLSGPLSHEVAMAHYTAPGDSRLERTGVRVRPGTIGTTWHSIGESYTQSAFTFHHTYAEFPTATLMEKTRVYEGNEPRVIVNDDTNLEAAANFWNRHDYESKLLWEIIEGAVHEMPTRSWNTLMEAIR